MVGSMDSESVNLVAQFGEIVTYLPAAGGSKPFLAVVEREPSGIAALAGVSFPENSIRVIFPNDATDGMTAIAKGQDKIRFKRNLSDSAETTYTVAVIEQQDTGIVASDGGMWTVLVK